MAISITMFRVIASGFLLTPPQIYTVQQTSLRHLNLYEGSFTLSSEGIQFFEGSFIQNKFFFINFVKCDLSTNVENRASNWPKLLDISFYWHSCLCFNGKNEKFLVISFNIVEFQRSRVKENLTWTQNEVIYGKLIGIKPLSRFSPP